MNWDLTIRKMMMKLGFSSRHEKALYLLFTRNEIFELSFMEMISLQLEALKISSGSVKLLAKNGWLLSVLPWDHQERRIGSIRDTRVLNRVISKTKMEAYWWETDSRHSR